MFCAIYSIPGEIPSKKNRPILRKTAHGILRLPNQSYMQWENKAVLIVRATGKPNEPLTSASISLRIYHGDLVCRDGDNGLTSVQDMLMKAGVLKDDNWKVIGTPPVTHDIDPLNPRVEIEVLETAPIDWARLMKEKKRELGKSGTGR